MTAAARLGVATLGFRGGGSGGTDRIVGATDSVIAQAQVVASVTASVGANARVESTPVRSVTIKAKDVRTTPSAGSVGGTIKI